MFSKYYQGELAYLRELGRAFALSNPTLAGLLAERGGDPDVERLLEGFAFLSARIRERLDAGVPEVVHGLAELLAPHTVRPVPACSIVEFTPLPRVLRARTTLPRGTSVAAAAVDGTSCRFATTQPVDLVPATLHDVALEGAQHAPVLRLSFQAAEAARPEVLGPAGLRLFVHADFPTAATVMLWLGRHLRGVQVRDPASGRAVRLPPTAVRAVAPREADSPLLDWPARAPDGVRLVQEYFTLPQRFLFVDVGGLEAARALPGERFELVLEFERPPALPSRVGKELFKLHCTPVRNLFRCSADPLTQRVPGEEHLLRAAGVDPAHMEVVSVDAVVGLRPGRGGRREVPPFVAFRHVVDGEGAAPAGAFFRVRRVRSPIDDGLDTYLAVGGPADVAPELGDETLSVELTCTNRSLPARLGVGDIHVSTPDSPTVARFRNLTPVSKPLRPPLGAEAHWRLLSYLALQQRSLADAEALRALLELHNLQAGADEPAARANRLRAEAVRSVRATPASRVVVDAAVRGARVEVELDEARLAGPGDAFLFGEALDALFGSSVGVNTFSELLLRLEPSRTELEWTPRSGLLPLL